VTDLIQQMAPDRFTGWRGIVARLDLMVAPRPSVPRKFRMAFTDRPAARAAIDRILEWPAEKLVIAHGTPITQDARTVIADAFGWLRCPAALDKTGPHRYIGAVPLLAVTPRGRPRCADSTVGGRPPEV